MHKPHIGIYILLLALGIALPACEKQLPPWSSGKLVIITSDYIQGAQAEFEKELVQLFSEQQRVSFEFISLPPDEINGALRQHKAHLAVASSSNDLSADGLKFGPDYQTIRWLVVCDRNHFFPKKVDDLLGKSVTIDSAAEKQDWLGKLKLRTAGIGWRDPPGISATELLDKVADDLSDCAIANELQFSDALESHPNLAAAFDIGFPSRIAWAFPADVDPQLYQQVQNFFAGIERDGTLRKLLDRYFGHINWLATMDAATFISDINTILPHYRHLFEDAAEITGIDWRLLAALSYQESQWNPNATSYTNVRGMMMLTEDTADRMNVENRLDARESILAGARYLAMLRDQMPGRIPEPDRTWLALAAYNQGYSHLEDARILTQRAKMNADRWEDVKRWLPYLNRPGYYKTLKHGYARGSEAVSLVENIRNYYDMLKRLNPDQGPSDTERTAYQLIEPLQRFLHYSR